MLRSFRSTFVKIPKKPSSWAERPTDESQETALVREVEGPRRRLSHNGSSGLFDTEGRVTGAFFQ
jgi:hypothetical protein